MIFDTARCASGPGARGIADRVQLVLHDQVLLDEHVMRPVCCWTGSARDVFSHQIQS